MVERMKSDDTGKSPGLELLGWLGILLYAPLPLLSAPQRIIPPRPALQY